MTRNMIDHRNRHTLSVSINTILVEEESIAV